MKIKRIKKNLVIETNGKQILVLNDEQSYDKAGGSVVINLADQKIEGNNVIASPGEYEIADVLFNVYNFGENLDKPGIVIVDASDGVSLIYVSSKVSSIDKSILEKTADADVLVMDLTENGMASHLNMVNEVEPYIFIPIIDKSGVAELSKQLGVGSIEEISTLNISQRDFTEENAELKVYLLKN